MSEAHGPRSAPRYTGVRTFAGLELSPLDDFEGPGSRPALMLGVPFDTATSWRPGARFGPEAIRAASSLLRPWHPVHGVDAFGAGADGGGAGGAGPGGAGARARAGAVVDAGDVAITPGNAERSAEQIAAALEPVCAAGCVPVVLGGDHSVALGELRAHAAARGPLALVLLDAHADTWEDYYGERVFHGTVVRRAIEEGLIDPAHSLIAGLRGSLYAPSDLRDARELGLELVAIEQLRALEPAHFAARVRERIGGAPAFLGFDIDVVDPSAAPGTGTPEVGGLLAAEAQALLRALAGIAFVGFDVVEVSPPYDSPAQITSLLAANIAHEMLALAALARL